MSKAIRAGYQQSFLFPPCLEDWIPADHPARFLREFVESLDLKSLGFQEGESEEGRPHYGVDLLLKVWLYGYFVKLRSSRQLEWGCRENVALIWLTGRHEPDHNTLWRFWRDHKKALRKVFGQAVEVALAARGRSTFSELRWYPPMEAAKGSLSWVFRAKQPESVRTGP